MKKIEAIIREEKLDVVREALDKLGYFGMTVTEVVGRGKQGGITLQWRVGNYQVDFLPKFKIELVILDEDAGRVTDAIMKTCQTGERGDGKIFVIPVENAYRIRTGDDGEDAI
jgi:nitrogen regulatory protein P-II 1